MTTPRVAPARVARFPALSPIRGAGGPWKARRHLEPGRVTSAVVGLLALIAGLGLLDAAVGVGPVGWAVGLTCGAALSTFMVRGLAMAGASSPGPADVVTYARGLLACMVAGLTAQSLLGASSALAIVLIAAPGLALDAVDGQVARRTGTTSAFGARFDGEVDAFLILVLSVLVAPTYGWWVLAAGLARYIFGAAGWVWPWMRGQLEFRYWRKVVAATMGITLLVAAAGVVPRGPMTAVLVGALALLTESFGRDVWSLWRARASAQVSAPEAVGSAEARATGQRVGRRVGRGVRRRVIGALITGPAVVVAWFALTAPTRPDELSLVALLRLPLEALLLGALVLVLPARAARIVAILAGVVLGVIALLKVLDLGAGAVLGRPFEVVTDVPLLTSGLSFVEAAAGGWAAVAVVVAAVLLAAVLLTLPWAMVRLARGVRRHRRPARGVLVALTVVWVVAAVIGLRSPFGAPIAEAGVGRYALDKVEASLAAERGLAGFEQSLASDPMASTPPDLSAFAGADVLVVVVESYGRVAVEGPHSGAVRSLLAERSAALRRAGVTAASGYLESPTFGGSSWLAHATLQSGLPVTDQTRYAALLHSRRSTLSSIFAHDGWRSVAVLPSVDTPWPDGQRFYRFDRVDTAVDLGYRGPAFGFSRVPDQFALAAFGRRELDSASRAPVVAQIELTSSHVPWAPLPVTVAPKRLGDGSVYRGIEARASGTGALVGNGDAIAAAYRTSIRYSLTSVLDFVAAHARHPLVVVMVGDHQPNTTVSGFGGNHDVPVSILSTDPALVHRVERWGWTPGLTPAHDAPVWPMAAFRDRFVALGSRP